MLKILYFSASVLLILNVRYVRAYAAQTPDSVPVENREIGKGPPAVENARLVAQALITALNDEKSDAPDLFFPAEPFAQLKDLKHAKAYYKDTLIPEYERRYASMRKNLAGERPLTLESFKLGFCKWKNIGTEYNKIAYYSCYRSAIRAKNAQGKPINLMIKTLINWGQNWYITHL